MKTDLEAVEVKRRENDRKVKKKPLGVMNIVSMLIMEMIS
jgi:hypothetical protein